VEQVSNLLLLALEPHLGSGCIEALHATRQNFFVAQRIASSTTESRMSALPSRPPLTPPYEGGELRLVDSDNSKVWRIRLLAGAAANLAGVPLLSQTVRRFFPPFVRGARGGLVGRAATSQ
jgi:hypothetical protein